MDIMWFAIAAAASSMAVAEEQAAKEARAERRRRIEGRVIIGCSYFFSVVSSRGAQEAQLSLLMQGLDARPLGYHKDYAANRGTASWTDTGISCLVTQTREVGAVSIRQ
mmetsp:Transcript_36063/g.107851  ORF Transcript_36063/g.107851 Transcript_36063/m.107851 type:complete len:109 (-) Transcript_36063:130-456(-)